MSENEAATKDDSGSRKRRKRSKGSQTCCEECCGTCHNMADSIAAIKEKLDKALNCIQEIEGLKQKSDSNNSKPRPLIAKFTFHRDKEFVLSKAKNLRGTNFAVARDFPKEIVEKRKLLVPILKDAKKSGHDANLVYDKLYINGQLYRP